MARHKKTAGGIALLLIVIVLVVSCFGPTQVTLEISRDAKCAPKGESRIGIFVGRPGHGAIDPVLETEDCTDLIPEGTGSRIGSLVIVPTDERDARVTVEVAIALKPPGALPGAPVKSPKDCLLDAKDCIVARRSFAFIEHEARTLPIRLFDDCLNLTCQPGTTCIARGCRPDDVEAPGFCDDPTKCDLQPAVDGGLPDAITDGSDDSPSDAPVDMNVPDAGPCIGVLVSGESTPALPTMLANATTVFWAAKGGHIDAIPKTGGLKKRLHTAANAGPGVTAFALDDPGNTLWMNDKSTIYWAKNLNDGGTSVTTDASTGTIVSMSAPGAVVYVTNGFATFVLNASNPMAASSAYFTPALSATRISAVVQPGLGEVVYGVDQTSVIRHTGDAAAVAALDGGGRDVLGVQGGAFVATQSQILRVGAFGPLDAGSPASPSVVTSATEPDTLARSGNNLYWIEKLAGGGPRILRLDTSVPGNTARALPLPQYGEIVGLAADASCVYFWADGAIRSAPIQ